MTNRSDAEETEGDVESNFIVAGVNLGLGVLLWTGGINHKPSNRRTKEGRQSSDACQHTECRGQMLQTKDVNLENICDNCTKKIVQDDLTRHEEVTAGQAERKSPNMTQTTT